MNTLLIDVSEIDKYYTISSFVKDRPKLDQYIFETQFQYIRPLIGQDKYSELIAEAKLGPYSPPNELLVYGDETEFLGLAPYLIWKMLTKFFAEYGIEVMRGGIKTLLDENSETISTDQRQMLINNAQRNADIYKAELLRFLNEQGINQNSPLTNQKQTSLDSITSTQKSGYYRRRRF